MTDLQIAAEDIREGDLVDCTPLLDAAFADRSWVWQPFGRNDEQVHEALQTAKIAAVEELSHANQSERNSDGTVTIYTDILNFIVPQGHIVTVRRGQS